MTYDQWTAWRQEWREEYKALTQHIRDQKQPLKAAQRAFSAGGSNDQAARLQRMSRLSRIEAYEMMQSLEEVKAEHKAKRAQLVAA